MAASDADIVQLAARAKSGEREALEALLAALYPSVLGFLRRRTAGEGLASDVAADLTQEALFHIAEGIASCSATSEGQLRAWALAVARNAALDALRGPAAEVALWRHSVPLDALGAQMAAWEAWSTPPTDVEPPSPAIPALLARLAVEAVDEMPEEVARLVWYRLVEGATWAEVGTHLGTTAGGAKRRYQRAQAALRRAVLRRVARLPEPVRAYAATFLAGHRGRGRGDVP